MLLMKFLSTNDLGDTLPWVYMLYTRQPQSRCELRIYESMKHAQHVSLPISPHTTSPLCRTLRQFIASNAMGDDDKGLVQPCPHLHQRRSLLTINTDQHATAHLPSTLPFSQLLQRASRSSAISLISKHHSRIKSKHTFPPL